MVVVAGVVGTLIGSFLNVVVHRVPAGRSVVSPPSACGSCGARVRAYDNIPVLSWLVLRGRCRDCRARISARYPLVELGAGLLFAALAWRFLLAEPLPASAPAVAAVVVQLVAFCYLGAIGLALALIDLETSRLPNVLVLPGFAVGAVAVAATCLLTGDGMPAVTAAAGAVILGGVYLVIVLIRPDAMGMGDVKLAGVLGLYLGWLGWPALAVGAIAGMLLGGAAGVVLLLTRRATRSTRMPYGPWLIAGAAVGVFAGDAIAQGYLELFGLS